MRGLIWIVLEKEDKITPRNSPEGMKLSIQILKILSIGVEPDKVAMMNQPTW